MVSWVGVGDNLRRTSRSVCKISRSSLVSSASPCSWCLLIRLLLTAASEISFTILAPSLLRPAFHLHRGVRAPARHGPIASSDHRTLELAGASRLWLIGAWPPDRGDAVPSSVRDSRFTSLLLGERLNPFFVCPVAVAESVSPSRAGFAVSPPPHVRDLLEALSGMVMVVKASCDANHLADSEFRRGCFLRLHNPFGPDGLRFSSHSSSSTYPAPANALNASVSVTTIAILNQIGIAISHYPKLRSKSIGFCGRRGERTPVGDNQDVSIKAFVSEMY